ncbi:sugar ABC transporter ATP-binding protein, partial [Amaricoccus sp. HAR-UPW-R2A-40]
MAGQVLEARGITRTFFGVRALDRVDFTLQAGEIHALVGENGAGKSTLVKILTGALARDAGVIRIDGVEIAPRTVAEAQALGIGTVYQEVNLLENLTVAENLYLGRQPRRFGTRRCSRTPLARSRRGRTRSWSAPMTRTSRSSRS